MSNIDTALLIEALGKSLFTLGIVCTLMGIALTSERILGIAVWNILGRETSFSLFRTFLKVVFKNDYRQDRTSPFLMKVLNSCILIFAILPFAGVSFCGELLLLGSRASLPVLHTNLSLFFILITSTIGLGLGWLGGILSNDQLSFKGAIRSISFLSIHEAVLWVLAITMILTYKSYELSKMVSFQSGYLWGGIPRWGVFFQPVAALLFLINIIARTNRGPFEVSGKGELFAGSGMGHSALGRIIVTISEYLRLLLLVTIFTQIFLGGWGLIPGFDYLSSMLPNVEIAWRVASIVIKISVIVSLIFWVERSIPKYRIDMMIQMFSNKMFPLAILNLIATVVYLAVAGGVV